MSDYPSPAQVRGWLSALDSDDPLERAQAEYHAEAMARGMAETFVSLDVEHDHGVVDWEQVDGRYEKFHRVRLVSDWRDT